MKIPLFPAFALALASFLPTSTVAQVVWQTVDNLAESRGRDIVVDAGGFVSLAIDHSTSTTGPVTTSVSVSADHGVSWQTIGLIAGYAVDLAVAPDGALFATGNRSATVSGRAFLWQSSDHGATWTVSDPSVGLSQPMIVLDVAAGNSGAIYICGQFSGSWMVRKGQRTGNGVITWATVDNYLGHGQASSVYVLPGLASRPDDVLVCGGGWTVRRSLNGGSTWATLDSSAGSAFALTTTTDGSIYVVGRVTKTTTVTNETIVRKKVVVTITTTTEYGWQTRKSSNGGASWTNVDYLAQGWPAYSIAADIFGRIFTVGFIDTIPRTWIVRGSADGGATWGTTDLFLPTGTTYSQGDAVAADPFGNVCVVGEVYSGSGVTAPIRRLALP